MTFDGRPTCHDCGALAPGASGETTLTSRLGWRLRRFVGDDGVTRVEWRCPQCWQAFKAGGGSATPGSKRS